MSTSNSPDHRADVIEQILEIELGWFLTVNPEITAECQRHPEAFKVMRRASFLTWSQPTLESYLEHIRTAAAEEHNLVREKYAKMQESIPCRDDSPALQDIIAIQKRWQQAAREQYPAIFQEDPKANFDWYLRCELDTYSPAVLESYHGDITRAEADGRNLIIETYDNLARGLGFASLDAWHAERVKA
jgi:hypothetical protein